MSGTNDTGGVIGAKASFASTERIGTEYARRLAERRATLGAYERQNTWFIRVRVAVALTALGILIAGGLAAAEWWLLAILAFVATLILHAQLLNRREAAALAVSLYERGVARLNGDWIGRGQTGDAYLPAQHLYARDLDLFGRGSLFELLSQARTLEGERTLAAWLLHPATPASVRARQVAVRELAHLTDVREQAALQSERVRLHVRTSRLRDWAEAPIVLKSRVARAALPALVAGTLASILLFVTTARFDALPLGFLAVQGLVGIWFWRRSESVAHEAEEPSHDLDVLAGLLEVLERQSFQSPLLQDLRRSIHTRARPASREISRLSQWVALLSSRENLLFAPVAALFLWTTQWAFALDAWRARRGKDLVQWLDAAATFEALLSLATFAAEHPEYPFPEIVDAPAFLSAIGVAHPALPRGATPNDVELGGDHPRALVVSGSNMSGKSTLLRALGVNAVLAQAGAPVRAARFSLSPLTIGASIQILDSLTEGRSRFMAEIQRLKQVVDLVRASNGHTLFLLDEVLSGTNSHDRRIGAEALLTGLIDEGAIGLTTTHDLAIGEIADRLAPRVANVHFADEFRDGRLTFDYHLRPGIVRSSNALQLMRSIGLKV